MKKISPIRADLKNPTIIATGIIFAAAATLCHADQQGLPASVAVPHEQSGGLFDGPVSLTISGAISPRYANDRVDIDMTTLETLPQTSLRTSTVVTDGILKFDGVLMRDLLDHIGARGRGVTATAINGYQVDIPGSDFEDFDVMLAWAVDGERMKVDDKGPFWIVYPRDEHVVLQDIRYDYRWVWQLNELQVN